MTAKIISNIKFNEKIRPQDDFFSYVNGIWIDSTEIPSNHTRWGTSQILIESTFRTLRDIIFNLDQTNISHEHKLLRKYYFSYLDFEKRNSEGYNPIKSLISQIKEGNSYSILGLCLKSGIQNIFRMFADNDSKDSNIVRPHLSQGGLGLPDRSYYLDPEFEEIRNKYKSFMKKMFELIDYDGDCDRVYDIEFRLAEVSMKPEDHREINKVYHKYRRQDFLDGDINSLFDDLGITDNIIVDNPKFFKLVQGILKNEDTRDYWIWRLLVSVSPLLSKPFVDTYFDFYKSTMKGQKSQQPLWIRGLSFIDVTVSEILAKDYVDKYFPEKSRIKMEGMVNNLKKALEQRILNLEWMEENTKKKALEKLERFRVKIGGPKKYKNFEKLKYYDSVFRNYMEFNKFYFVVDFLDRLEKPFDPDRWEMPSYAVNAYFVPERNEIVFPAGILQPPFFDPDINGALNYGSIGSVIGHEMIHGFDDQGRKYDKNGNLNDWWSPEDSKKFDQKADLIVEQYNKFKLWDKNVNGKLTQGENIADLGGVTVSLEALKLAKRELTIDDKKLFFVNYALDWRSKLRKKEAIRLLTIDPHSPGCFRVNGVLSNLPEFYETFRVKKGDKLYKENITTIW